MSKKVDCSLLPPTTKTLEKKLLRTKYVAILWSHANTLCPADGLLQTDYGWCMKDGVLQPVWSEGRAMPNALLQLTKPTKDSSRGSEEKNVGNQGSNSDDEEQLVANQACDSDNDESKIEDNVNSGMLANFDNEISELWSGDSDSDVEDDD